MRSTKSVVVAALAWGSLACSTGKGAPVQVVSLPKASPPDDAPLPPMTDAPHPPSREKTRVACKTPFDARAFLRNHAIDFGDEAAVAASLPRMLHGRSVVTGGQGDFEIALDGKRYRLTEKIGPIVEATGIDDRGPWTLAPGVVTRLTLAEAGEMGIAAWILRRSYLGAFDADRDKASCFESEPGDATVTISYDLPELGGPTLRFDFATSAIQDVGWQRGDGVPHHTAYSSWAPPDEHGVRWPSDFGAQAKIHIDSSEPGLKCQIRLPRWPTDLDCLAPPPSSVVFAWPEDPVHVPFSFLRERVLVPLSIGGRKPWALLVSLGNSLVDLDSPTGKSFKSEFSVQGTLATTTQSYVMGELGQVSLGALAISHFIGSGASLPRLADFGDQRPEVTLGLGLFAASGVRIDYAKKEVVFAKDAKMLHDGAAQSLPVKILANRLVATAEIDGIAALVSIDTSNGGGFQLTRTWAAENDFPGARRSAVMAGHAANGKDVEPTLFRLAAGSIGPIHHDDRIASIVDTVYPTKVAGAIGNEVLSHCAAVIFDVPNHALWFEPPCDRPVPEYGTGFGMENHGGAHPWVITSLADGCAAEHAGLQLGDRLLTVDGRSVATDRAWLDSRMRQSFGTRVAVTVQRENPAGPATVLSKVIVLSKTLANAGH